MSNSIQGLPPIDPSLYQQNVSKTAPGKNSEFLDTLQKTLDQAQQMQAEADQKVTSLLNGQNTGDVQSVLLALDKAEAGQTEPTMRDFSPRLRTTGSPAGMTILI